MTLYNGYTHYEDLLLDAGTLHKGMPEEAYWELWQPKEPIMPARELCTAVGCVAIVDLAAGSTALGFNKKRNAWEIPAGRIDPEDRTMENTAIRETYEETGSTLIPSTLSLFVIKVMFNPPGSKFKPITFIPHFYGYTKGAIEEATGSDVLDNDIFDDTDLQRLEAEGEITPATILMIREGLRKARQDRDKGIHKA